MIVFIGADHRGFRAKLELIPWLQKEGFDAIDCGNTVLDPTDDYPDFGFEVAEKVAAMPDSFGIVVCGSGAGVCIAANKVNGIRAALGTTDDHVQASRHDDNVNVLALGADFLTMDQMKSLIQTFLSTSYIPEEKYERRIAKILAKEHSQK
jgi:ribose 5-phosphate isomerase B